jgi:hypothetical protein
LQAARAATAPRPTIRDLREETAKLDAMKSVTLVAPAAHWTKALP